MKSREKAVEAKGGPTQLKCGKVFVENKPRGESINEIGKTEGVVLLTEFHLTGSNHR